MMINIERADKKPDPRVEETQSIPVEHNTMKVSLEVLGNPAQEDAYLLYIPPLPKTVGGETLYIISNQERLTFLLNAAKKMVAIALMMTQEKVRARKLRLN